MNWQEIIIESAPEGVEAVANIADEVGAGGVAIEDPQMVINKIKEGSWDAYELPEYLTQGENAFVRLYLPVNENLPRRLEDMKQRLDYLNTYLLPGCIKNISYATVKEEDWAENWKAYYKPVRVGRSILIKPSWEEVVPAPGDIIVELDPGMAFGTGTHATTVLCLEFLEDIIREGHKVYDVGTGSGILAITGAKLGAEVVSIDIDEVAVRVARENAALNGVAAKVEVKLGDLLAGETEPADIVVANIVADVIKEVIPQAKEKLKDSGLLLVSGIFVERLPDIYRWLEENGFKHRKTRESGDWAAVLAVKEA
ncbi:50S ribosomal protein L11 methyltransferase [Thermincola ferriacetica]|uniref:Ribosomal protein L11 methyltransferase n=1 Tax=Thermincola ferriacetica TaxID=281456 RepID=A0A0L6W024_9FIRM|nr:50S ribosomal protein L11 methyltransferase [Thermincola ferriacetica]KNZ68821.1 50S ribosomal protein L11 methyltransferase [Thermincola ferriacetica]